MSRNEISSILSNYNYSVIIDLKSYDRKCSFEVMDDRTTVHMIAKVLNRDTANINALENVFNNLIDVDKSMCSENLIYYYRIINENGVIISLRNIFNNRLEDLDNNEIVSLFHDYGCSNLLCTLCEVLRGFHSMNIVCGAIKLSNIIMKSDKMNDKYFYLCDYCMRVSNSIDVNYITPEEISGKEIGIEVDIWCVGIVLYYILSGKYPFEGGNEIETKRNVYSMSLQTINIEFGGLMNELLSKLLRKNASDRITVLELDDYINRMNDIVYLRVETERDISPYIIDIVEEKEEKKEEEKEENNSNDSINISLSSMLSSITQFVNNKTSEIISKSENIHSQAVYYKTEMAKRQAQLQLDMARRQAEIQSNMRRKEAELQSKIANIKAYLPNYKYF